MLVTMAGTRSSPEYSVLDSVTLVRTRPALPRVTYYYRLVGAAASGTFDSPIFDQGYRPSNTLKCSENFPSICTQLKQ